MGREKSIIILSSLMLIFISLIYPTVPKLGTYGGPQEIRFSAFSCYGSTRAVGNLEEYYIYGEPPYSVIWSSAIIGFLCQDVIPPAPITHFSASPGSFFSEIKLVWRSPGDDYNRGPLGTLDKPAYYYIQYSATADVVWSTAQAQVVISTYNVQPYSEQTYVLSLTPSVTYYFRIWTRDPEGNLSKISIGATSYAQPALSETGAFVVYYDSSTPSSRLTPKYRGWDNGYFSEEYSLQSADGVDPGLDGHYSVAVCPKRNEFIFLVGGQRTSTNRGTWAYIHNGSTWVVTNLITSGDASPASYRAFYAAYEQNSGRCVVVYRKDDVSTSKPCYRIWDGNNWSSEYTDAPDFGSAIYWIKLIPKPETDEIMMVVQTDGNHIKTAVWDGSSWTRGITLENTADSSDQQCFDGIYENVTKRFILVTSDRGVSKSFKYCIYDSTSWAGPYTDTMDVLSKGKIRWIRLAAKPNSDEILLAVMNDEALNVAAAVWYSTSSSFGSKFRPTDGTNVGAVTYRAFDVCYERSSGKGLLVFSRNAEVPARRGKILYSRWTGTTWEDNVVGPTLSSAHLNWFSCAALQKSDSNEILVVVSDTGTPTPNLYGIKWDGSSFGSATTLETNTSARESFAVSYRFDPYAVFDNIPPAAVTDLTGEVLGDGMVKLTWSTAGDDGWDGVLPCGSRFLFVFSTATPTDSELTWPATYSVLVATYGVSSPQKQTYIIANLPYETTWYFRMRTRDEAGNWSGLSNACTLYVLVLPAAITTLSALPSQWGRCIELSWISPGDDGWSGNIVGGQYRIRYSTYVIDDPDFWETGTWDDFKNKFEIIWDTNTAPLQEQFRRLTGLQPGVTYYIRIWTRDEHPLNWSKISNAATSWAQWVVIGIKVTGYAELAWATTYNFDWLTTNTSSIAAYGILIENTGNVFEDYGLRINTTSMRDVYNTVWTIDNSTVVKNNVFVLEFLFYDLRPQATHYGTAYNASGDDVITDSLLWSTDGVKYHPPAIVGQPENTKGVRVPAFTIGENTDIRKGWFRIHTPLATSTTDYQTIPVEFWAQENENVGPPP